jgi:hypothetical protein
MLKGKQMQLQEAERPKRNGSRDTRQDLMMLSWIAAVKIATRQGKFLARDMTFKALARLFNFWLGLLTLTDSYNISRAAGKEEGTELIDKESEIS